MNVRMNYKGAATTASSRHTGGLNLATADGSVKFLSDSTDINVWWAIGSRDGAEVFDNVE